MPLELPQTFIDKVKQHFGEPIASKVIGAMDHQPSVAIRKNPIKPHPAFDDESSVPWTNHGRLLEERPFFAHDPLFHAGAYYVQDPSSMILEAVLTSIEAPKDGIYLDACAAPGGKSTILLDYLDGNGFLISNEIEDKRIKVLQENLLKWGHLNAGTTKLDTVGLSGLRGHVTLALVDAPCSGEGMFRKDPFAVEQWNQGLRDRCCALQSHILENVAPLIEEGGFLVYSTCTLNPEENEQQVKSLLSRGFELATPDLKLYDAFLVASEERGQLLGYYLLPGISMGEGLFIAVLRKVKEEPEAKRSKQRFTELQHDLSAIGAPSSVQQVPFQDEIWGVTGLEHLQGLEIPTLRAGLPMAQRKGKDLIPLHGAAMINPKLASISADLEQSLAYLRKETVSLPAQKGWNLVRFENIPLGWVKVLPNRINNYYPGWLRLRT